MKLKSSNIELSWKDKIKGISIPNELTSDLAEDIGIHIGDGNLYLSSRGKEYYVTYAGHAKEDIDYFEKRIIPLKEKLFNVILKGNMLKINENELAFVICSKGLFNFYNKTIGIPTGNKSKIVKIPNMIKNSTRKIKTSFMRGLADTDFSITFKRKSTKHKLNYYPTVTASFASEFLIKDIASILRSLEFTFSLVKRNTKRLGKIHKSYEVYINGKNNLEKWMKMIGFNNPKHLTKYLIWEKYGFCPPCTSIEQRKQILSGMINPLKFYY